MKNGPKYIPNTDRANKQEKLKPFGGGWKSRPKWKLAAKNQKQGERERYQRKEKEGGGKGPLVVTAKRL